MTLKVNWPATVCTMMSIRLDNTSPCCMAYPNFSPSIFTQDSVQLVLENFRIDVSHWQRLDSEFGHPLSMNILKMAMLGRFSFEPEPLASQAG